MLLNANKIKSNSIGSGRMKKKKKEKDARTAVIKKNMKNECNETMVR